MGAAQYGPGYFVATNGDDGAAGTIDDPWRTVGVATRKLAGGDVLYVRGGEYDEQEGATLLHTVTGSASKRTIICGYGNERPHLNGSYPEFRTIGNSAWELHDPIRNIYRSVAVYPDPGGAGITGFFTADDGNRYSLIPYRAFDPSHAPEECRMSMPVAALDYLSSDFEQFERCVARYMGPGTAWNPIDWKIYIRLQPSSQESVHGRLLPRVTNLDPRQNALTLMGSGIGVFLQDRDYVVIDGIDLTYWLGAFSSSSIGVTRGHELRDVTVHCGMHGFRLLNDVVYDRCRVYGYMPPWLGSSDVKGGEEPAKHIRKFGIQLGDNCDVGSCVVDSVFDGVLAESSHDSRIHHSVFSRIWDDMYQIYSKHHNIEIDDNFIYGAGPSHDRTGEPGPAPGTKYIHHNVIDNTTFEIMWTRHDPKHLGDEQKEGWQHPIPLSRHGTPMFRDPWKFYNNTVIIGRHPPGEVGFGRWGPSSDPVSPTHDVYNNIFVLDFTEIWVHFLTSNLASEIYDGNVYYAVPPAAPFWNRVITSASEPDDPPETPTLAALKALVTTDSQVFYPPGFEASGIDANPQLDAGYRPSRWGPAVRGAVDLSATGFPGATADAWRGALAPRATAPQLVVANFGHEAGNWRVERHLRLLADLTGDRRADIAGFGNAGVWVALNNGNGTFEAPRLAVRDFGYNAGSWRVERHPRFLADLTGDRRADIVGFGNDGVWIALNIGNGHFQSSKRVITGFGYDVWNWRVERHPRFLADLTGHHGADIVGFGNTGVWVALNNGNGIFQVPQRVVTGFGYDAGSWRVERHPRFLADLTGDRRADIVGFGNDGVWVALNNGDGTFQPPNRVVADFGYDAGNWRVERHPRFLADLTGDGRADIVGFGNAGVWVALNNGDGTFEPPRMVVAGFGYSENWRVERHPRFLADVTGDGRADIVGFGDDGVWASLNNGNGTFQTPELVVADFGYDAGGWRIEQHPRFLADLTGDSRADIVGFGNAGVWTWIA